MKIDLNQSLTKKERRSKEQSKTIRFTVSLAEELLDILDNKVARYRYSSRSEYIRDLIRQKIIEDKWTEESMQVTGVLTIIYDSHDRDLTRKLIDIEEHTKILIISSTRIHLDHFNSLESIMIRGKSKEVERVANEISGIRGIKFAELTKAAIVD